MDSSDVNDSIVATHISKSENSVDPGTISTGEGNSETDTSPKTSPLTEKTVITPEIQPQSIEPMESHAPTPSIPPETAQYEPSNAETTPDGSKSEVVETQSSSPSLPPAAEPGNTETTIPANTITVEAETDSKETTNQPADQSSGNDGQRKTSSKSSNSGASLDPSSPPIRRDDDFITSPYGKNAIAERSPGGRYVRFMEKLGSGASKEVYRAYDTQEGIEVAWNVVHLAGVPRNERNRIVNEVQLLERLHHHNIISFHGSWVNRAEQQVNFVTEILSSGTLKSFITKVQVIRWKIAKRWAVQILKGLEYLHSQDPPVIHRDLKCENIFINGTSGDLRIGDLGLSTVHRNGKQLSVLGTPEFMAPDMYEENPYDEKVDVYAFGMCMLEIFTKEIPYRECTNPAQIYKKVSRGDPPDSLKRIQSTHAREFVELCLGRVDENGKYIRPSATELLAHPFLQKRPSDDDEVEVLPVFQQPTIRETNSTSSPSPSMKVVNRTSPTSSSSQPNETLQGASSSSRQIQHSRTNSLIDDGSDKFELMPDSEVNFRKVKVLVGRGMELKEEEELNARRAREQEAAAGDTNLQNGPTESTPGYPPPPVPTPPPEQTPSAEPTPPTKHYLVAAAVIENDSNARPYQDDILKLVVTLPVEGQTQNVQFDFHLIQDDAIQVAKEMVAELGIPQGAVLEISETISGLARAARVSQDKYIARQNAQGHVRTAQMPSVSSVSTMASNSERSQHMVQQPPQQVGQQVPQAPGVSMTSSTSHQSMPEQQQMSHNMVQQAPQQVPQAPGQSMVPSTSHQSMPEQQHIPQNMMQQPPQQVSQQVPQATGQSMAPSTSHQSMPEQQHVPQNMMQQPPQQVSQQMPQAIGQSMVPSTSHQSMPEQQHIPQNMMQQPPQQVSQQVPQAIGQSMTPSTSHQSMPDQSHVPQNMVQQPPQQMSQQVAQAPGQGMITSTSHRSMPDQSHMSQSMVQHPPQQLNQTMTEPPQQQQQQQQQQQPQHVVPNHSQTPHLAQSLPPQGFQGTEQSNPVGHAPLPSVPMQQPHVQMQPLEGTNQASEMSSQPFAPQSIPVATQQPPSHMNPVNANQQADGHINHHVAAPPIADTNALQPNYGQAVAHPSQMNARQTSGVSNQSDASAPMTYAQSLQVPISSQHGPQHGGHHAPGNHVMQQQPSGSAVAPQSGIVQAPGTQAFDVPPQGNQVQGYTNGATPQPPPAPPVQSPLPQHPQHFPVQSAPVLQQQQVPSLPQAQSAPQMQQIVSAAGPPGQVDGSAHSVSPQVPFETQDALAALQQPFGSEDYFASSLNFQMNGVYSLPAMERLNASSESDHLDEELAAELRKLDEEYKKTVSRAKKVFDSRMDNMARLQHQREAQHQRTLSEHEKQRAEFEKRLQQEEIEQNRRIEQLQKEWERKRLQVKGTQDESPEFQGSDHDAANQPPLPSTPESDGEEIVSEIL